VLRLDLDSDTYGHAGHPSALFGLVWSTNEERLLDIKSSREVIRTSLTSEAERPLRDALAKHVASVREATHQLC
jgi:uncharacterized membrane protein